MSIESFPISKDGSIIAYKLKNKEGSLAVQLSTFGARLTHLWTLNKDKELVDVLIGFDTHEELVASFEGKADPYIGAVIELNNSSYSFNVNFPKNGASHHGGFIGIDKRIWTPKIISTDPPAIKFVYVSPHNEENYPGTLEISVTYTATDENQLKLEYRAKFLDDGPLNDTVIETALSLTNHAYFNLTGFKEPTVENHICSFVTTDYLLSNLETKIFNGELSRDYSDKNTVLGQYNPVQKRAHLMDFMKEPKSVGPDLYNPLILNSFGGYNHVFTVLETKKNDQNDDIDGYYADSNYRLNQVAKIWSNNSGISMRVLTDEPAFVFYTGNFLPEDLYGKNGIQFRKHSGFALQLQRYNNALNFPKWKEQMLLQRGKLYSQNSIYEFSII
ncbi:Aldose 1-epimerase [Smittium culicis]|uniref:Aldose 1-epimerase n=1 Tax=Smittium culicis TaxID=133412 RepID=A0A1R1X084_9FUNG|nr:Aldose 1-epimerase [Smittium culicis]OMJ16003.1 Aldose 1-epimerase [Smittium culicis]